LQVIDPEQKQDRASQQHQMLRENIQKYAPQATVDQLTLTLGLSGAIYNSSIKALKDKLGVTQPRLNTLLTKLLHMAVASLNRIWDQQWAMINRLHVPDKANRAHWLTACHQSTSRMCHQEQQKTTWKQSQPVHDYLPKGVIRDNPGTYTL
jgi:hypothetical protein